MQPEVRDRLTAAVRELAQREAPAWEVAFSDEAAVPERPLCIDLCHPLSRGVRWHPSTSEIEDTDLRVLETILATNPDFAAVEDAPEVRHPALLRDLRIVAELFDFSRPAVATVSGILFREGCLSEDEAEWLRRHAPQ